MAESNGSCYAGGAEKTLQDSLKDNTSSKPTKGVRDKDCHHRPKEIIAEYMSTVTVHGINKIYQAENISKKCFWGTVFLTFFGIFVWEVVMLINKINQNEIRIEFKSVENQPMIFPTVTICNKVPFGIDAGIDIRRASHGFGHMNNFGSQQSKNYIENLVRLFEIIEAKNTTSYLKYNITECGFNLQTCSANTFDIFESTVTGKCYIFNKNGTFYQTRPGHPFGLSLKVFINQDEYIPFPSYKGDVGLGVDIQPPGIYPIVYADTILLEPGKHIRLSLKKTRMKRLKKPFHDNCTDGTGISQKLLFQGKYSRELCFISCYVTLQYELCKFIDPVISAYLPIESELPVLTNAANYSCIAEAHEKFSNFHCDCPVACQQEFYDLHISQSAWPSHITGKYMLEKLKITNPARYSNISMDFITRNFLSFEIYLSDFSVTEIIQKPAYGWCDFLSDLGGQLGLWLGASVFSLFEFGSLILRLVMSKFHTTAEKTLVCEKKLTPLND